MRAREKIWQYLASVRLYPQVLLLIRHHLLVSVCLCVLCAVSCLLWCGWQMAEESEGGVFYRTPRPIGGLYVGGLIGPNSVCVRRAK